MNEKRPFNLIKGDQVQDQTNKKVQLEGQNSNNVVLNNNQQPEKYTKEQEKQAKRTKVDYSQSVKQYTQEGFTHTANQYLGRYTEHALNNYHQNLKYFPLFSMMRGIAKVFFLNEIEIMFLAYILEENKWKFHEEGIQKMARNSKDFLGVYKRKMEGEAPDQHEEQEYKQLLLFLVLNTYAVKFYLNDKSEMEVFDSYLTESYNEFQQFFQKWSKSYATTSLKINPKKLNNVYSILGQKNTGLNKNIQQDYNNLVDDIIQISPPYNNNSVLDRNNVVGMDEILQNNNRQREQHVQQQQQQKDNNNSKKDSINKQQQPQQQPQQQSEFDFLMNNFTGNSSIFNNFDQSNTDFLNLQKKQSSMMMPSNFPKLSKDASNIFAGINAQNNNLNNTNNNNNNNNNNNSGNKKEGEQFPDLALGKIDSNIFGDMMKNMEPEQQKQMGLSILDGIQQNNSTSIMNMMSQTQELVIPKLQSQLSENKGGFGKSGNSKMNDLEFNNKLAGLKTGGNIQNNNNKQSEKQQGEDNQQQQQDDKQEKPIKDEFIQEDEEINALPDLSMKKLVSESVFN